MKLVDTNVLLNAISPPSPHHAESKRWLDNALSGAAPVGFAWMVLIGFVRLATHPSVLERPLSTGNAMDVVEAWLGAAPAQILRPGDRHPNLLRQLLATSSAGGNTTNDAHLAALALEHRATVITFDSDFTRFATVHSERPR